MSAANRPKRPKHEIGSGEREAFDSCLLCLYKTYGKNDLRKVPPPMTSVAAWFLDSVRRRQEYSEAPYDEHTTIRVVAKMALFPPSGKGKFNPAYGNAWLMVNKIEEAIKGWANDFKVDITEYTASRSQLIMPDLGPTTYQHFLPLIPGSNASDGCSQSSCHSLQQISISQQQRGRTDIPESVTSMRQGPFSGIERDAYNRNLQRFRIADQRTDDGHDLSSQLQQSSCQTILPSQSPHQSSQSDLPYHPPPSQQLHIHPAHNWQVPAESLLLSQPTPTYYFMTTDIPPSVLPTYAPSGPLSAPSAESHTLPPVASGYGSFPGSILQCSPPYGSEQ